MPALKLIVPPEPIVTWDELGLSGDAADQALGEGLIAAATQNIDGYAGILGRAIGQQTWELYLDAFPCGPIKLPLPSLISVSSVTYDAEDGFEQTIDPVSYEVDDKSSIGWIVPLSGYSWPSTLGAVNVVRVRFVAGYAVVPAPIKAHVILKARRLFGMAQRDAAVTRERADGVGAWEYGGSDFVKANTDTEENLIAPYNVVSL